jgi:mannose-6-phosphate isomerase-like protein (cupin superfamily)
MIYLLALLLVFGAHGGKNAEKKAEVAYVPAREAEASLAKLGARLLDTPHYAVMEARRNSAGEAEQHEFETDVFYIIDGSATFVTGGTIEGAKTTGPGEIRGKSISGGKTWQLSKGDIITIPKGTPHWYSGVSGTLTYFIVKVR